MTSPLLTLEEGAEYLRTTERHVRRLVEERRLPYVKVGKFIRLRKIDCDAFIDAGLVTGAEWRPTVVKIQRRGRAS